MVNRIFFSPIVRCHLVLGNLLNKMLIIQKIFRQRTFNVDVTSSSTVSSKRHIKTFQRSINTFLIVDNQWYQCGNFLKKDIIVFHENFCPSSCSSFSSGQCLLLHERFALPPNLLKIFFVDFNISFFESKILQPIFCCGFV